MHYGLISKLKDLEMAMFGTIVVHSAVFCSARSVVRGS